MQKRTKCVIKGAAAGVAIGAGTGAVIGHQGDVDNAWEGSLVGAAAGAVLGGAVGFVMCTAEPPVETEEDEYYETQPEAATEAEPEPVPEIEPTIEVTDGGPGVFLKIVLRGIQFDFDKSNIKPEYMPILDQAAAILQNHPERDVVIEGHTCWIGSDKYNMVLSLRRATAVKQYLVGNGVAPARLSVKGFGESKPVADNKSEVGRQMNRRIEFKVLDNE